MKGLSLGSLSEKRTNHLKETFAKRDIELDVMSSYELSKQLERGKLTRPLSQYWDFCILDYAGDKRYKDMCKTLTEDGVRLFNTVAATDICRNKWTTYQTLRKHNIPQMPTYETYHAALNAGLDKGKMVVKARHGRKGENMFLCSNRSEVLAAIKELKKHNRSFIIQKFCETTNNRAARVYCIRDKGVGGYVVCNPDSFKANLAQGATMLDEQPPASFFPVAEKVARIIGTDLCAIDFLYGENGSPIVCEVNSMPGFHRRLAEEGGFNLAALFVDYIINETLQKYNTEV